MKKFLYLFSFLFAITFTACENGQPEGPSGDPNAPTEPNKHENHEWVDLGLPSGTKWATCNVGANSPEEYGDYFAWGETKPKSVYDWSTYKWYNSFSETLTKYTGSMYDNKSVLDLEDDAAHVNWGGAWRMPTIEELVELEDNCIWAWSSQKGVNGYTITSIINGNSIFLPAAGYRKDSDLNGAGSRGDYWSSSLSPYVIEFSDYFVFSPNDVFWIGNYRYRGHSIRPVLRE